MDAGIRTAAIGYVTVSDVHTRLIIRSGVTRLVDEETYRVCSRRTV